MNGVGWEIGFENPNGLIKKGECTAGMSSCLMGYDRLSISVILIAKLIFIEFD